MLLGVTFIEPFTECFLSGTLCALAVSWFYPTFPCQILFAVYVLGWLCGDYVLVRTLQVRFPITRMHLATQEYLQFFLSIFSDPFCFISF